MVPVTNMRYFNILPIQEGIGPPLLMRKLWRQNHRIRLWWQEAEAVETCFPPEFWELLPHMRKCSTAKKCSLQSLSNVLKSFGQDPSRWAYFAALPTDSPHHASYFCQRLQRKLSRALHYNGESLISKGLPAQIFFRLFIWSPMSFVVFRHFP